MELVLHYSAQEAAEVRVHIQFPLEGRLSQDRDLSGFCMSREELEVCCPGLHC